MTDLEFLMLFLGPRKTYENCPLFIWTTKRTTELKQDITDLRVMRDLLKSELLKGKPVARRYRGKKIGRFRE